MIRIYDSWIYGDIMADKRLLDAFYEITGREHVLTDEMMSRHTTFRIGGPADYFVMPGNIGELASLIRFLYENGTPYTVIGNGSNLLVGDRGYRGVIIQLFHNLEQVEAVGETMIRAQAGALLARVASAAYDASLEGFEFAGGIPGTIGGAAVMNAGAYGGEFGSVLTDLTVVTKTGEIKTVPAKELAFGYRTSAVAGESYTAAEARITLVPGDRSVIRARMEDFRERRISKQPLEFPSAGSTFKRPEGFYAGKLIMEAGLGGCRIGGAEVSLKHCGFVINRGGATAEDVRMLIADIQERVMDKYHVMLEPEVRFLGEF